MFNSKFTTTMKAVLKLANKRFILTNENGITTNAEGKSQEQSAEDFIKFVDNLVGIGYTLVEKDY